MKAAVLEGIGGALQVCDVDLGGPGAGEVLVRIAASSVCGSDLNASDGKRTLVPFPAILGHEAAGEVVEVGPDVTTLRPGDHVVTTITPSCGTCASCLRGRPNYCLVAGRAMSDGNLMDGSSRLTRGGKRLNHFLMVSSFAEYAVVPESGAIAVPEALPLDRAALISCAVLTGIGAVANTAKVPAGARVAVFGCGGVGLNVVQGAMIAGASNSSGEDPVAAIRRLCDGVDYAFEASGREPVIQQAWRSLDVAGELVIVGLLRHGATLTVAADPFVNEQRISGCYYGSSNAARDVPALAERYLAGEILLDEIISERIPLGDLNEAFGRMRRGEGNREVVLFD
jgi:S-(hydroxymethyl)glutathione dehydrogenase/alcohol dehydrogenase